MLFRSHGYVPISLCEGKQIPSAIAMDINEGPLLRAKSHIEEAGLTGYIQTRLSDGLAALKAGEGDTVLIAGMGGILMEKILHEGRETLSSVRELILQPQSEIRQFRTWLREQGLRITDEKMVEEDGKFYPMMRAVPEAGCLGVEDAEESRRSGEPGWQKPAADAERSGIQGMERVELCKLYDRYGGFLLQRGDSTLLAFLQKEERVYTEILDRLQGQGLDCDKRRMRYAEVETLLAECRRAKAIALRGAGCGS